MNIAQSWNNYFSFRIFFVYWVLVDRVSHYDVSPGFPLSALLLATRPVTSRALGSIPCGWGYWAFVVSFLFSMGSVICYRQHVYDISSWLGQLYG